MKLIISEDPVCGSGNYHIVQYRAEQQGKSELIAYQAYNRGGILYWKVILDRVTLAGKACLYSVSEINIYIKTLGL